MPGVAIGVDRWRRHHEVSILVAAGGVGRYFGSQPRAKVSMMIMRLPQYGHGRGSARGTAAGRPGWRVRFGQGGGGGFSKNFSGKPASGMGPGREVVEGE